MHVLLIRHAERLKGASHDSFSDPLSEHGIQQARDAGSDLLEYLEKNKISPDECYVLCSPLLRTKQTHYFMGEADPALPRYLSKVIEPGFLQEIEQGALDPNHTNLLAQSDPDLLERFQREHTLALRTKAPSSVRLPYGESGDDVSARIHRGLPMTLKALDKMGAKAVIVISHNSILASCIKALSKDAISERWMAQRIIEGVKFSPTSIQVLTGTPTKEFAYRGFTRGKVESNNPAMCSMRL